VKAGDKWGGHRVKAIKLIDQALDACGQTQTPGNGEMKSGATDETSIMTTATTELTTAQKDFTNAKNPYGECKGKALPLITQALQELQLAATAAKGPKKAN
jgi:tryptophanyl-tRNA synthetase